jgi:hypothetical protein
MLLNICNMECVICNMDIMNIIVIQIKYIININKVPERKNYLDKKWILQHL